MATKRIKMILNMGIGQSVAYIESPKSFVLMKVTGLKGTMWVHLGLLFKIMAKMKWNGYTITINGIFDPLNP